MRWAWLFALALGACDDGGDAAGDAGGAGGAAPAGDAVDCTWYASMDHCKFDAYERLARCFPPAQTEEDAAAIDAARSVCTYADGTTVRFTAAPIVQDVYDGLDGLSRFGDANFSFEVYGPDGAFCAALDTETPQEETLRFPEGVYRRTLDTRDRNDLAYTWECPDGSRKTIKANTLLTCLAGVDLPTYGFSSQGPYLGLVTQIGVDPDTKRQLLFCDAEFD